MTIGFSASLLLLGGASNEQRVAERAMRTLNLELEARVDQRTAELREIHGQLEKAAFYDSLTGLPNRRLLEERFAFCGAAARRRGDRFALLLIDLDRFKEINDNLGHDAGDALLVEAGCRLATTVRECDVVARMGGDEFVILLPETGDRTSVESVCTRILAVLTEPMLFNGRLIRTAASIGVALFPDHGATWQTMYKSADLALYEAKRGGRAMWRWYAAEEVGRE
jgi:diguanylate cyclase (GGDEF)-like protein